MHTLCFIMKYVDGDWDKDLCLKKHRALTSTRLFLFRLIGLAVICSHGHCPLRLRHKMVLQESRLVFKPVFTHLTFDVKSPETLLDHLAKINCDLKMQHSSRSWRIPAPERGLWSDTNLMIFGRVPGCTHQLFYEFLPQASVSASPFYLFIFSTFHSKPRPSNIIWLFVHKVSSINFQVT